MSDTVSTIGGCFLLFNTCVFMCVHRGITATVVVLVQYKF